MLPSWIKFKLARTKVAAGIHIGRQHVSAVMLEQHKGLWIEKAAHAVELPRPIYDSAPDSSLEAALVKALQAVSAEFKPGFMPVRIAVPDLLIRTSTLELDALPQSDKMQQDLLRWRFAKDMQRDEDTIVCAGQPLGNEHGKQLLFAQVLDRNWQDGLLRAFEQAAIIPWSLNAISAYRHNAYYEFFGSGGGALITIDPESWGFQLWDKTKRLRYVRSRWREATPDYDLMISEIERVIRSHASNVQGFQIERLYIAGMEDEIESLRGMLDQKLHQSVSRIELPGRIERSTDKQHAGALLLARTTAIGYED